PLRRLRVRPDVLPTLLPLVQPRASSRRAGPDDAPPHPLRFGRGQVAAARRGPARGVRSSPRALPARSAGPSAAADSGVDQQAPGPAGSGRAKGDQLMTATHKFPMPTVSFDLTSSAAPKGGRQATESHGAKANW